MTESYNHSSQPQEKLPLWIKIMQSPQVAWIQENPKKALYGVLGICVALVVFLCFFTQKSEKAVQDYEIAQTLSAKLKSGTPLFDSSKEASSSQVSDSQKQAFDDLVAIIHKNPALAPEFDGIIAQEMIIQNNIEDINPYAKVAIDTLASCKNYADFSQDSVKISQNEYSDAYERAVKLRSLLDNQSSDEINSVASIPSYALYSFNLLQIINLADALGKTREKENAIADLRNYLDTQMTKASLLHDKEELKKISAFMQEGSISLLDYLQKTNVVTSQN